MFLIGSGSISIVSAEYLGILRERRDDIGTRLVR